MDPSVDVHQPAASAAASAPSTQKLQLWKHARACMLHHAAHVQGKGAACKAHELGGQQLCSRGKRSADSASVVSGSYGWLHTWMQPNVSCNVVAASTTLMTGCVCCAICFRTCRNNPIPGSTSCCWTAIACKHTEPAGAAAGVGAAVEAAAGCHGCWRFQVGGH
jgi:hypothetical protein